ncbi:MAG: acyl-CoA dehydrogenase family protein, partial [Kofleriaceae bacterium]
MTDRVAALDDPQLRPFAPVLYVAWSDLDLDDAERAHVLARVGAQPWLRPAARAAIRAWIDPARPPSREELARLRALIARVAATTDAEGRASIARATGALDVDPEAHQVARALGEALGIYAGDAAAARAPAHAAEAPSSPEEVAALAGVLDGSQREVRSRVRAFLAAPERRAYGLPVPEMRALVGAWLGELAATGIGALAFPGVTHDGDLQAFLAAFEELGHGDLSLLVKCGVQFGLYGGAVWALGTMRHHSRLPGIAQLDELGCFAMSEVGHGSNVADLETTAVYDPATRELVIHTPGESARKEWIGGAARDARWAVVFAQLEVAGERHGVHAIVVPIRRPDGGAVPGVRTGDSGHKLGLAGVDNGRLWFERVRVPVANLLDRFASIDEAGVYHSPID